MTTGDFDAVAFERQLQRYLPELGLDLSAAQCGALLAYWQLFLKWNAAYNLSAIREPRAIFYKHLVDSLVVVRYVQETRARRVIDVGTGGGLPGIPLAICLPDCHFTLLDSAGKKMRFLFQVKHALGLDNVELAQTRVETWRPDQGYEIVISRAFSSLKSFTRLCTHLLVPEGEFWAMKGQWPEEELREMEKHYIVRHNHQLQVPGVDADRCLLIIQSTLSESCSPVIAG